MKPMGLTANRLATELRVTPATYAPANPRITKGRSQAFAAGCGGEACIEGEQL